MTFFFSAAEVVRRIFEQASAGKLPSEIATELNRDGILVRCAKGRRRNYDRMDLQGSERSRQRNHFILASFA